MTDPFADLPAEVAAELFERYAEPQRAYHTVEHIRALLRWYGDVHERLQDPEAVVLAILFHDAVYDSARADDEALSAELLRARMAGRTEPAMLERAIRMVEATAKHAIPDGLPENERADMALFLDMDLSILGARAPVFDRYEVDIRAEYGHVTDAAFRAARARILRTFAERERLYFSDWGRERFETTARANIARSLTALETATA